MCPISKFLVLFVFLLFQILNKMKRLFLLFFMLILIGSSLQSCRKKSEVAPPKLSDEQKRAVRQVNVSVVRYEQALFALDTNHLAEGVKKLYGSYPEILISKNCWQNKAMIQGLKAYLKDPIIQEIYKDSQKQFPDLKSLEKELTGAFKIYLTHFPNDSVPRIYTTIPGIDLSSPSVFGYDNSLIISLDMYLGENYKHYAAAGMPKFIARRCTPDRIALDCFSKGVVYQHLPDKTLLTLLDNMIYEGKKMFFTQTMFPNTKELDILGYTKEQYEWAQQYEGQIWQYFIEKNLIYSKNEDDVRRMIDETPFTRDFGNKSAGRIGIFIGLQIVKDYMAKHPEITLDLLMKQDDAQAFLKESGYKPKFNN